MSQFHSTQLTSRWLTAGTPWHIISTRLAVSPPSNDSPHLLDFSLTQVHSTQLICLYFTWLPRRRKSDTALLIRTIHQPCRSDSHFQLLSPMHRPPSNKYCSIWGMAYEALWWIVALISELFFWSFLVTFLLGWAASGEEWQQSKKMPCNKGHEKGTCHLLQRAATLPYSDTLWWHCLCGLC